MPRQGDQIDARQQVDVAFCSGDAINAGQPRGMQTKLMRFIIYPMYREWTDRILHFTLLHENASFSEQRVVETVVPVKMSIHNNLDILDVHPDFFQCSCRFLVRPPAEAMV